MASLYLSCLIPILLLFIQAAPPVGSWQENDLDTDHFLFQSPIFLLIWKSL